MRSNQCSLLRSGHGRVTVNLICIDHNQVGENHSKWFVLQMILLRLLSTNLIFLKLNPDSYPESLKLIFDPESWIPKFDPCSESVSVSDWWYKTFCYDLMTKVTLEIAKVCLWLSCYHWHILSKFGSWIIFGCFAKYLVLYTVKDNLVWYHIWTDYFIYMMFTSHYWYTVSLSYSIYHVTPSTNINVFFIFLEERR